MNTQNQLFSNKPNVPLRARFFSIAIGVLGLVIIVSIVIGGALLASRRWDPKWNPFRPKDIKSQFSIIKYQ